MLSASVDWEEAWGSLVHHGWARLPASVGDDAVRRLADARHAPWKPLPAEEGVVRQQGSGSYVSFEDAAVAVHELASRLVEQLANAATPRTPVLPPFNEVTWTRYPAGLGHISEHRDPPAYTGIIAVTTLLGEARFVACSDAGDQHEWLVSTGDIVLLEVAALTAAPLGRLDWQRGVALAQDVEDPVVTTNGRTWTGHRPPVELFVQVRRSSAESWG